jgi:hypothetical protein
MAGSEPTSGGGNARSVVPVKTVSGEARGGASRKLTPRHQTQKSISTGLTCEDFCPSALAQPSGHSSGSANTTSVMKNNKPIDR